MYLIEKNVPMTAPVTDTGRGRDMLNFISPWMTQYTREKHEGKREPKINVLNRKSHGRKCGRIKQLGRSAAKAARVIGALQARVEEHPNDAMASARLAKLLAP